MGAMVYKQKNQYMKRCEKCDKLSHYIYRMTLGSMTYNFCSGMCANNARLEFENKEKLGIGPSNPEPISDLVEDGDLEND